jgi:hypothetical protein
MSWYLFIHLLLWGHAAPLSDIGSTADISAEEGERKREYFKPGIQTVARDPAL